MVCSDIYSKHCSFLLYSNGFYSIGLDIAVGWKSSERATAVAAKVHRRRWVLCRNWAEGGRGACGGPWWNLYRCLGGTSIVALVEPLSLPWWNLYCCPAQGIAQRQLSGRVLCLNIFVFCKSTVDGRIHHFKPMYLARVIVYLPVAVAEKQVVKSTCTTSLMALNFASSKSQRS